MLKYFLIIVIFSFIIGLLYYVEFLIMLVSVNFNNIMHLRRNLKHFLYHCINNIKP